MNFTQSLSIFPDIIFCMDFMVGMVKEDILTNHFGSTWSHATDRAADTSTERAYQSRWWHKRMETKRNLLDHFYYPRFASGYGQNHLVLFDES